MRLIQQLSTAPMGRRRRGGTVARRCMAGAVLGIAAVVAGASPAGAQTVDALCTGTIAQSWDPGLRLQDHTVHYTADLAYDCESSDSQISGAEIHVDAVYMTNCLVNTGSASATVEWDTGETSDIEIETVAVTAGGGVQVYEAVGEVTDGKFLGDTVQMLNTFVSLDILACLTHQGMTHREGTTTMTLLG